MTRTVALAVSAALFAAGCLLDNGGDDSSAPEPVNYGIANVTGDFEGEYRFTAAVVLQDSNRTTCSIGLADNAAPLTVMIDLSRLETGMFAAGDGLLDLRAVRLPMAILARPADPVFFRTTSDPEAAAVTVTVFDGDRLEGEFTARLAGEGRTINIVGTFHIPLHSD